MVDASLLHVQDGNHYSAVYLAVQGQKVKEADVKGKRVVKEVKLKPSDVTAPVADEGPAKDYRRMSLVAEKYGIAVAFLKKLINDGRLTRYKLGEATFVDCNELNRLMVRDAGNHGPERAPQAAK
jgi:hypothetical protein